MGMTTKRLHPQDEAALAGLFDDLRAQTPAPSRAFLARVLADAEAVAGAGGGAGGPAAAPVRPRGGWFDWLWKTPFGRAAGGLATAGVVGFSLGLSGGLTGAQWLADAAPLLFQAESDSALTLLPEADSFVIALADEAEVAQ